MHKDYRSNLASGDIYVTCDENSTVNKWEKDLTDQMKTGWHMGKR